MARGGHNYFKSEKSILEAKAFKMWVINLHSSYFSQTCWADVTERKLPPPMVPNVNSDQDTRYFNFYQENNIDISEVVSDEDLKLFKDF